MTQANPQNSYTSFLSKRIMSLIGLVPLGLYVILHLWTNLSSLGGPLVYQDALLKSRNHPAFLALEIFLGLAVLIHLVIGLRLILKWRPNLSKVKTFHNLKFTLQRLSGLGLMLFLVAHVVKARILPSLHPPYVETWMGMHIALSEPLTFSVYILGLLGISFHLANGFWTFCVTWGLTVTANSQRKAEILSVLFFIVLMVMGGMCIYGFLQPIPPEWAHLLKPIG